MLKKTFILFLALLTFITCYFSFERPVFLSYSDSYTLYLENPSSLGRERTVNKLEYALTFSKKGESVILCESDFDLESLFCIYGANLLFSEEIEEGICYYAYSPKIRYQKRVNGYNVNLHVFVGKDRVVLGTPLIFGSF